MIRFHLNGERYIVSIHKKRMIRETYKAIAQSPFFLFEVKFSKDLSLTKCLGFFLENKLTTSHQSGFKPGDSCINQLLSITYQIYKSFDHRFELRSVFLDISKAFDKVWHDRVIFNLE